MIFRFVLGLLVTGVLVGTSVFEVRAKSSAPVSIEVLGTEVSQEGTTIVSQIQLIAESDLEELSVSFAPLEGLRLLSSPDAVVFKNVRKGELRTLQVEVEKIDPEVAYLSVFATTVTVYGTRIKTIAVRYGKAGSLTQQKTKSVQKPSKQNSSDDLILLPGSPR